MYVRWGGWVVGWYFGGVGCGRECGCKGGCVGEWVVKVGREGERVGGLSVLCCLRSMGVNDAVYNMQSMTKCIVPRVVTA